MAYSQVPTRSSTDKAYSADTNQLQKNIEALKGGTASVAPTRTLEQLAADKIAMWDHMCVVGMSTDQTITTGGNPKLLNFDTVILDPMGWFDAVTNYRFTPLVAGKYQVFLHTSSTQLTAAGAQAHSHIYLNGASVAQNNASTPVTVGNYGLDVTWTVDCNGSTDYIDGRHYMDTDTGIDGARTQMTIRRIQ